MSSCYYSRVSNTTISGAALLSTLTGEDVNALNFQGKLTRNPTIALTTANHALTVDELVQSVLDEQLVDGTGLTAARSLTLGPDSSSQARALINLFDLRVGRGPVLMNFAVGVSSCTAYAVSLANTSGTQTYVQLKASNSTAAATQTLFAASALAGSSRTVEVTATSVASGSEVVIFNLLGSQASA
jgi:hypothetical protein